MFWAGIKIGACFMATGESDDIQEAIKSAIVESKRYVNWEAGKVVLVHVQYPNGRVAIHKHLI